MKKLLSLTLVILLLTSPLSLASSSESHSGYLLKMIGCTASEWEEESGTRALFTVCALMDLLMATNDIEDAKITEIASYAATNDGIAFARNASIVMAVFGGEEDVLMIAYQPASNEFTYMFFESAADYSMSLKLSMVKQVIEEDNGSFYEVSSLSYYQYLQKVAEIINK